VTFHTDASIYRCALEAGHSVGFEGTRGRRIFVYLTEGRLSINGQQVGERDQARIDADKPLLFETTQGAEFVLIDVPSCKGWGYSRETLRGGKR
jgi:redox-sensitive bicupin YhaK (pirin superfamily)